MATSTLSLGVQSNAAAYGIFWQLWPQFDVRAGERRAVGLELELIGAHSLDLNHLDPACPLCHHVKSVLLEIADLMIDAVLRQDHVTCDIDSHPNSILCLPALGNRPAVSVSVDVWWNDANGKTFEADLLNKIKTFLSNYGIHQR
jgi:hypothetical protein